MPINPASLGQQALEVMPAFEQIVLASPGGLSGIDLDREAFVVRKRIEHELPVYFPSLSSRTLV